MLHAYLAESAVFVATHRLNDPTCYCKCRWALSMHAPCMLFTFLPADYLHAAAARKRATNRSGRPAAGLPTPHRNKRARAQELPQDAPPRKRRRCPAERGPRLPTRRPDLMNSITVHSKYMWRCASRAALQSNTPVNMSLGPHEQHAALITPVMRHCVQVPVTSPSHRRFETSLQSPEPHLTASSTPRRVRQVSRHPPT